MCENPRFRLDKSTFERRLEPTPSMRPPLRQSGRETTHVLRNRLDTKTKIYMSQSERSTARACAGQTLRISGHSSCVFFEDADGEGRIHDVRPLQIRSPTIVEREPDGRG